MDISGLEKLHGKRQHEIKKKLEDFRKIQTLDDKEIFAELCFCTLTPQSKAFNCWDAVLELKENGLLEKGNHKKIGKILQKKVRFHNNKAKYIVKNRELFFGSGLRDKILKEKNEKNLRDWLVENIHGYGYKEASHFLRNIGFRNLAILDRHILNNLVSLEVIDEIPKSLTKKKYFEIEEKFKKFSEKVGIPVDELDLLFWSLQTGKVFK